MKFIQNMTPSNRLWLAAGLSLGGMAVYQGYLNQRGSEGISTQPLENSENPIVLEVPAPQIPSPAQQILNAAKPSVAPESSVATDTYSTVVDLGAVQGGLSLTTNNSFVGPYAPKWTEIPLVVSQPVQTADPVVTDTKTAPAGSGFSYWPVAAGVAGLAAIGGFALWRRRQGGEKAEQEKIIFHIKEQILPEIKSVAENLGVATPEWMAKFEAVTKLVNAFSAKKGEFQEIENQIMALKTPVAQRQFKVAMTQLEEIFTQQSQEMPVIKSLFAEISPLIEGYKGSLDEFQTINQKVNVLAKLLAPFKMKEVFAKSVVLAKRHEIYKDALEQDMNEFEGLLNSYSGTVEEFEVIAGKAIAIDRILAPYELGEELDQLRMEAEKQGVFNPEWEKSITELRTEITEYDGSETKYNALQIKIQEFRQTVTASLQGITQLIDHVKQLNDQISQSGFLDSEQNFNQTWKILSGFEGYLHKTAESLQGENRYELILEKSGLGSLFQSIKLQLVKRLFADIEILTPETIKLIEANPNKKKFLEQNTDFIRSILNEIGDKPYQDPEASGLNELKARFEKFMEKLNLARTGIEMPSSKADDAGIAVVDKDTKPSSDEITLVDADDDGIAVVDEEDEVTEEIERPVAKPVTSQDDNDFVVIDGDDYINDGDAGVNDLSVTRGNVSGAAPAAGGKAVNPEISLENVVFKRPERINPTGVSIGGRLVLNDFLTSSRKMISDFEDNLEAQEATTVLELLMANVEHYYQGKDYTPSYVEWEQIRDMVIELRQYHQMRHINRTRIPESEKFIAALEFIDARMADALY